MMCFANSRKLSKFIEKAPKQRLEHFDLYNLKLNDTSMNLYVSRKRATTATHIHCTESGDIIWEQFYPFGGMSRPAIKKYYALKPERKESEITIVVIRGTPSIIVGLDDGEILSHLSRPKVNNIFLMSEKNIARFLDSILQS